MSEALKCTLCPHGCRLKEGQTGFCRARRAEGGRIVPLGYGRLTSVALDPIEKKPLYHFYPGSYILSVGSFGCNLHCPFCQNYTISQADEEGFEGVAIPVQEATPLELAEAASRLQREGRSIGVAFTYNEPLVAYEYVLEAAKLLKERGLAVVLVTNGQIKEGPWRSLLPYVDAANIDLKGFDQKFYDWIKGDLATTKRAIELAEQAGCHVEVTTLVIPGKNDNAEDMRAEAAWLKSLGDIPLHLSRYFPRYECDIPMTPVETLGKLKAVAEEYLTHVHLGNV